MRSLLDFAIEPLRCYADFRGRSRRTELLCFYALLAAAHAVALPLSWPASQWTVIAIDAATIVPSAALMARRLHDIGFSGWWLAPLAPVVAFNAWKAFASLRDPHGPMPELPMWTLVALLAYGLCLTIALLWDDEIGPNRFGANPRWPNA